MGTTLKGAKKTEAQLRSELTQLRKRLEQREGQDRSSPCEEQDPKHLAIALESLGDGVAITQADGTFLYVNPAFERLTGLTSQEMVGKDGRFLLASQRSEEMLQHILEALRQEKVWTGSFAMQRKNDSPIEVEVTVTPKAGMTDELTEYVIIVRDMTERKRTEDALRESEKRFRDLVNLLPQTVFEIDLEGKVIFSNYCGFDAFGYTPKDIEEGLNVRSLFVPDDWNRIEEDMQRIAKGGIVVSADYTALRKDGSTFPVTIYPSPILRDGKPVGIRGIVVDNTKHEQAREALRKSEETYRDLVENIQDVIYSMTSSGTITYISPSIKAATGYEPMEVIGRHFTHFILPEDWPLIAENAHRILLGGPSEPHEYRFVTKTGEIRWMRTSSRMVVADDGTVGMKGVLSDITERTRAEEALRESEATFRTITNTAKDAVVRLDNDG
ncbi:MAG: PAS domain S-box protein, partial [bacterium]